MLSRIGTLLILLTLLTVLGGCINSYTNKVYIHPIDREDILRVDKGAKIYLNDGSAHDVDRHGWFMSNKYVDKVIDAKIDK